MLNLAKCGCSIAFTLWRQVNKNSLEKALVTIQLTCRYRSGRDALAVQSQGSSCDRSEVQDRKRQTRGGMECRIPVNCAWRNGYETVLSQIVEGIPLLAAG